jgi:replicative DNA helicase
MTVSLEKLFFAYILENKKYFEIVKPFFFKNSEIRFVYDVIRKYILSNSEALVPSPKQILEMVALEDKEKIITKDILKAILKPDSEFSEESWQTNFLVPKFNGWILANKLKAGTSDIIEHTRDLDSIADIDDAMQSASKIKEIIDEASRTNFMTDDDDFGSDFDIAELHSQDSSTLKVRTGFTTLDHILGGGWDVSTLNMIMAETNGGKSLWMQNFAVLSANLGYNVLYVTLEMSEKKVLKRMGSMRLKIPIDKYDDVSKNSEAIKQRIQQLKRSEAVDNLFDNKVGKIFVKFWAAGTTTVNEIDAFLEKMKDKRGIKMDLVIVDYITLLAPLKGSGIDNNLYLKGKHFAEGLRAIGSKYKCPMISAIQVAKDAWNNADITLANIPESKAIAETADTFFALIRTEEMKRQNIYRLKLLKQRDGDFSRSQVKFDLNPTYLTIENDAFVDVGL